MAPTRNARPGGRTARTRTAVLDAAAQLLLEMPLTDVTVGQIAARAGVNQTTIYRKWGSKSALITDTLITLSGEHLAGPDTGTLRGDLVAVVSAVAGFLRTPAGQALAYLSATNQDESAESLRDAFWNDRFDRARAIFTRAQQRGEIPDTQTADLAYEALIGTMHFRVLSRRAPLDDDIAERLVDLILDGVLDQPRPSPTPHTSPIT